MFRRVLIANRGEVAVRIIHACRELGIESVAVYSDADSSALHVALADRAVAIGPAPATESYLSIPRIIDAARATLADAIHPGYGFLSENHAFAEACSCAGIAFVGPPGPVLLQMGSKLEARRIAESADVPVVPGETPDDQSDEGVRRSLERVGVPAMVKASAGGGGKGMRRIDDSIDAAEAIQSARREAVAAFGDGTLYVERLIERPHHVEVQVFADANGRVVHLFERECSTQRRHQKIIEESPSPNVPPALRRRITDAAVRIARAASYRNAGTVEFLVDLAGPRQSEPAFYFLEVNARLQVEHPVTEQITGIDLVRAQLLVAAGEPARWRQEEIGARGHAIEARIYAEDPANEFTPQAGPLLLYREPRAPGIRIDSGVREGDRISVYYDPLIAKVTASAESRDEAISRLVAALRDFPVLGIRTNIPFLIRVLESGEFRAARIHTRFLDEEGRRLREEPEEIPPAVHAAWGAAELHDGTQRSSSVRSDPWDQLDGWRSS